jgi:hypothetical protein
VLTRFGDAVEPGTREQVAKALVGKGVRLGELGRPEEEMEAYDQVVTRFGDTVEPGVREQVATALVYKAGTLGELGRRGEEMEAYHQVVTRSAMPPRHGRASR